MNKFKPWQDQLLSLVGQGIQEYGFDPRPRGQDFSKEFSLGRAGFHLAFIKHQNDFDVTSDVAIRFNQVEELVNRDNKRLSKSEKMGTYTLGCELGNLSEGRQKRWTVSAADDVPAVSAAIVSFFAQVGLPYIERFSDAEHVLKILGGDGPDSRLHSPIHDVRAKKAVALALLTQGREAAQSLAESKLKFLESRNDFGLDAFRLFLDANGLLRKTA